MKSILKYLFRIIEVLLIICSLFICINNLLTPEDNLAFAISRIENLAGYDLDKRKTELILHKTNRCDSIVMVHDDRSTNEIYKQMQELVKTGEFWTSVQVPESEAYAVIREHFSDAFQTSMHFRPVCEIDGGNYDYMFLETEHKSIHGCLIDVDTGTIALYIYLD